LKRIYFALAGLLLVFAAAALITTASAFEGNILAQNQTQNQQQTQNPVTIRFTDNGETAIVTTYAETIACFLETADAAPALRHNDVVIPGLEHGITDGMHIEIIRAFPVHVRLNGHEQLLTFYARPGSILSAFVNELRLATDMDFTFDRAGWHRRLAAGDVVELESVIRLEREVYEFLEYTAEYTYCDELYFNQQELYRAGVLGVRRVETRALYIGNAVSEQAVLAYEIVSMPIPAVIRIGTALPPGHARAASGEIFTYARSVRMEATAYTLSFECTGRHPDHPLFGVTASGMMAQVGVVAVDTNVIPFHTQLYIEGYGFAVAGDRGGAIRGYKVDLYFNTREETIQFGRQNLRVWILLDEDAEI